MPQVPRAPIVLTGGDLVSIEDEVVDLRADTFNEANGPVILDGSGAINAIIKHRTGTAADFDTTGGGIVLEFGEIAITTDTLEIRVGDGASTGGVPVANWSSSEITVLARGTPTQNGTALAAAYAAAQLLTPNGSNLGAANRASVVFHTGKYNVPVGFFDLANYVDLIGYGRPSLITGDYGGGSNGTLRINDKDVRIKNFDIYGGDSTVPITFQFDITNTKFCEFEDVRFIMEDVTYPATDVYQDVAALWKITARRCYTNGTCLFGSTDGLGGYKMGVDSASLFEDCEGGASSFGGNYYEGVVGESNTHAGTIRRCKMTGNLWNCMFGGKMEFCEFNAAPNAPNGGDSLVTGAKFYGNTIRAVGSNTFKNGVTAATIAVAHNRLKASSVGSNITLSLSTIGGAFNLEDDDV